MKLCDRCPQAGSCLLNYLGKACHKLRMHELQRGGPHHAGAHAQHGR